MIVIAYEVFGRRLTEEEVCSFHWRSDIFSNFSTLVAFFLPRHPARATFHVPPGNGPLVVQIDFLYGGLQEGIP